MKFTNVAFLLSAALQLFPAALHAQTITLSPGYTNIGVNQTLQYTATVTGLPSTKVTWEVSGVVGGNSKVGTITQAGLYTAPAVVPTVSTLVEALGSDNKTLGLVYVNVEAAGPSITSISPNPAPTGNPTLTITGSGFKSGAVILVGGNSFGTTFVNSTTLTTSPWQGPATTLPVQVSNPGTLYGAAFNLPFVNAGPPPPPTISPTSATVNLGATEQFTATNATSFTATAGTVTSSGLYTAPATMPSSATATVKATGAGGSASATVTLVNPNAQKIAPTTISLNLGATWQFTSLGATSWTAVAGTVNSTGLYTAPATMTTSGSDTVSATGPNGTATAIVTLIPPTPVISGVGSNNQLPLGLFSATVSGSGFLATSTATLNGTSLAVSFPSGVLTIGGFSSQSGQASLIVSNGAMSSAPFTVQVGIVGAVTSAAAARRFLERAAFGPTPTDAATVQTIGEQAWISQQFAMPQISNYNIITSDQGGMPTHFLTNAVTNPDQLRQRVALALGQIFVTSIEKLIWNGNVVLYQNMLLADAFTNYRQIMEDVTLSPAMGQYLDMANNAMADPATGSVANENYARELMQLFTIGTNMLNQDGSLQLVGGLPVPTYSQFTVTEFARVYTGWTYAPAPGQPVVWNAYITGNGPMAPYAAEHDSGSKQLLAASTVGSTASSGFTPRQDLDNALDNIFNHPNIGPFVGKLLIQHLVKSNPSPAYISRVAAAFNGANGTPRGDMQATITAILMDPEAIANDAGGNDQPTDGHLQEPALFIPAIVRAFGGTMTDQNYYSSELANLGQDLFDAPSVFNFYSPSYVVGGSGGLRGPEFQIDTPNNAIVRANEIAYLFSQYSNPVQSYGPGTTLDLTPFLPLASNPATLVNALDLTLTHGVMPATMKSDIVNAVAGDSLGVLHQVQTACYLILTSSYYNVWH